MLKYIATIEIAILQSTTVNRTSVVTSDRHNKKTRKIEYFNFYVFYDFNIFASTVTVNRLFFINAEYVISLKIDPRVLEIFSMKFFKNLTLI